MVKILEIVANYIHYIKLHFWGHFNVCEYIIARVKDKNPQDISRSTPLHRAAQYGHLQIYKLILDNVGEEEENRRCGGGWTPKRLLENRKSGQGWPPLSWLERHWK